MLLQSIKAINLDSQSILNCSTEKELQEVINTQIEIRPCLLNHVISTSWNYTIKLVVDTEIINHVFKLIKENNFKEYISPLDRHYILNNEEGNILKKYNDYSGYYVEDSLGVIHPAEEKEKIKCPMNNIFQSQIVLLGDDSERHIYQFNIEVMPTFSELQELSNLSTLIFPEKENNEIFRYLFNSKSDYFKSLNYSSWDSGGDIKPSNSIFNEDLPNKEDFFSFVSEEESTSLESEYREIYSNRLLNNSLDSDIYKILVTSINIDLISLKLIQLKESYLNRHKDKESKELIQHKIQSFLNEL